jgi:CYTH domain-containing protein
MTAGPAEWRRSPGRGVYARLERERRFLVPRAAMLPAGEGQRQIEDRYLDGTTLRLRRVRVGDESVFKLTQKVRCEEGDPSEVALTNIYLEAAEHERLARLPHALLVKTRRVVRTGAQDWVVDELRGRHRGLRLAEVEVADLTEELDRAPWLGPEVTHDGRFSGGALARATDEEIADLVRLA